MDYFEKSSILKMAFILPVARTIMKIGAKIELLILPNDPRVHLHVRALEFYTKSLLYRSFEIYNRAWIVVAKLLAMDVVLANLRPILHSDLLNAVPFPGTFLSVVVMVIATWLAYLALPYDLAASDLLQENLPERVEEAWAKSQNPAAKVRKISRADMKLLEESILIVKEDTFTNTKEKGDAAENFALEYMKHKHPSMIWIKCGAGSGVEIKIPGRQDAGIDLYGFDPETGATHLGSSKNYATGIESEFVDALAGVATRLIARGIKVTEKFSSYTIKKVPQNGQMVQIKEDVTVLAGATFNMLSESEDGTCYVSRGEDGVETYIPKACAQIAPVATTIIASKFTKGALHSAKSPTVGITMAPLLLSTAIADAEKAIKASKLNHGESE